MPYITPSARDALDQHLNFLSPSSVGELNYCISMLMLRFHREHGENYTSLNGAMGAAGCAVQEFYRRVAVPYETRKMQANGDIYAD